MSVDDELDSGDRYFTVFQKSQVCLDQGAVEIGQHLELRRGGGGHVADSLLWHAHVSWAKFESFRRVYLHRIEEFAVDELSACDELLRCAYVLLYKISAVDRCLHMAAVQAGGKVDKA